MVIKIDTYGLASACDDAMEKRFPRSEYSESGNIKRNKNMSSTEVHAKDGFTRILSQANSVSILITGAGEVTYKPRRLLSGKTAKVPVSLVKILLNDVISASEASLSHTGVNLVMLYVFEEDVSKFDNLLCVDGNKLVDLAGYIRSNDIAAYDFYLMG